VVSIAAVSGTDPNLASTAHCAITFVARTDTLPKSGTLLGGARAAGGDGTTTRPWRRQPRPTPRLPRPRARHSSSPATVRPPAPPLTCAPWPAAAEGSAAEAVASEGRAARPQRSVHASVTQLKLGASHVHPAPSPVGVGRS
jgi:hypothetical protein